MLEWIGKNWCFSIPILAAVVYAVCAAVESSVYKSLNIKGKDAPAKGDFPGSVTILEALTVFAFLLWYNCGAVLWQRGWRPFLLAASGLFLILLAAALVRTFRRLTRPRRKGGRGYPGAAAAAFCTRRTVGSFVPGWFVGLLPAGVFQSIGLEGVDGTVRLLVSRLLPALLPLLFLAFLWLIHLHDEGVRRAVRNGSYDPLATEDKKEKSLADLMYEAQMIDLIERGIREEEEENERRYREYWEEKDRK